MGWEVLSMIQAKDDAGSDQVRAGEVLRSSGMQPEGRPG